MPYILVDNGIVIAISKTRNGPSWIPVDAVPDRRPDVILRYDGARIVEEPYHEDQKLSRRDAYKTLVDPITCEINRLRDMGGTPEEIAEAEARREAAVAAVKEQYPYPEVTNGR